MMVVRLFYRNGFFKSHQILVQINMPFSLSIYKSPDQDWHSALNQKTMITVAAKHAKEF